MPNRTFRRKVAQPNRKVPTIMNVVQPAPVRRNRQGFSESSDEVSMKGSEVDIEELSKNF
jgi:hypothetical protein